MHRKLLLPLGLLISCSEPSYDRAELLKPETCQSCHPIHYDQWAGSMHAYAAEDPVFRAMNARGQRETNGELGDLCVGCHAPMAVREGFTTDGLNLDEVPQHLQGVTCYFCHNTEAVAGTHNNPLVLANDTTMRGAFADAVENDVHASAASSLHNRGDPASSDLCGTCHDVVTPSGFHLERTHLEWNESLFAHNTPAELQTCGRCHMQGSPGRAAQLPDMPIRRVHDHSMPGVDVALTPWPGMAEQRALVEAELDRTLHAVLCVNRVANGLQVTVDLENLGAGHSFPSGAAHDRRIWVEVEATFLGQPVFHIGSVNEGAVMVDTLEPDAWWMGDRTFKADGSVAHMFWDVASAESQVLPAPTTRSPLEPGYIDTHVIRRWTFEGLADRIEARIHVRPVGLDVIDDLIDSGDLDPAIRDRIPTFTLERTGIVWTPDLAAEEDRDQDGCLPDF